MIDWVHNLNNVFKNFKEITKDGISEESIKSLMGSCVKAGVQIEKQRIEDWGLFDAERIIKRVIG